MLSSILMTSALATAVLARPGHLLEKREIAYVTAEAVTVTDMHVVTVNAGDLEPATTPAANVVNVVGTTVVVTATQGQPPAVANKDADSDDAGWRGGNNRFGSGPPGDDSEGDHHRGPPGGWGHSAGTTIVQQTTKPVVQSPRPTSTYEAPAPTSTQEAPSAPPADLTEYSSIVVAHHNVHRQNHSVPDLAWDDALAATAAKIAATCVYEHNTEMDGGGYGQNIAAGVEANNVSAVITDLFYNGEIGYFSNQYGKADPDMGQFELWGHFTQIIWKDTNKVGCATHACGNGGLANVGSNVSPYFTVCNYGKPGNYGGEYGDNVLAPKGDASVWWNYGL